MARLIMKVRYKKDGTEGYSSSFNMHGIGEVLVSADWGGDSAFIRDLDIEINGTWKDMSTAFVDKDIIPDNFNQYFAPPYNEECKERGYNP